VGGRTYSTYDFAEPENYVTDDGLTAVLTPKDANLATDSEDDDAFAELQENLSPGEAQRVLDTMRPLSKEENKIVDEIPGLEDLRRVDDAEQEKWLLDRSREGYHAMDTILDDAIYGEHMDKDERLERLGLDSDLGFGFGSLKKLATAPMSITSSVLKKIPGGKYVDKLSRSPLTASKWLGKKALGAAARFIPGRDAAKAKAVAGAFNKLVTQHANWLGLQAQKAGQQVQSPAYYQTMSKPWALAQLKAVGLPTTTKVSGADVLGADIAGADVMGSWYNPFSWFANLIDVMFHGRAAQQMSPVGPTGDGQPMLDEYGNPVDPSTVMPDGTSPPDASSPDASATPDYYPGDQPMEAYPSDNTQGDDLTSGISGDDSLGAVTTEIMAGTKDPTKADQMLSAALNKLRQGYPLKPGELAIVGRMAKAGHPLAKQIYDTLMTQGVTKIQGAVPSKADQMLSAALNKLRQGYPLKPGELAIVGRLAKAGNPTAKHIYDTLMTQGVTMLKGDDSGDWLYKLNPLRYVTKSSQERALEDKERTAWSENAERRKETEKRQQVLDQAMRAQTAQAAVAEAKKQAEATEAQLKAIESSLSGVLIAKAPANHPIFAESGSSVGHEKPTAVWDVVRSALDRAGKRQAAKEIYDSIRAGRKLTEAQLKDARGIAKMLHKVKVVHGDLMDSESEVVDALHGVFVGGCMRGQIEMAIQKNKICGAAAKSLGDSLPADGKISPAQSKALRAVGQRTFDLQNVVRSHTSGRTYRDLGAAQSLQRSIVLGAAKAAMTPAEAKMLQAMRSLAKAGNPRAAAALKKLAAQGVVVGGDFVGSGITDAFKTVTSPIWWPAQKLAQGTKWVGQKMGIVSKGAASPQDVRLAKMRASFQRRKAAEAKAMAADAQTEAELRAQQSIVDAANAEADAADADALSKEAAMKTAELEADPSQSAEYTSAQALHQGTDDDSGAFIGEWTAEIEGAKDKKIVAKAGKKDAAGAKVRAGAAMYRKIKAQDPQAKVALKNMISKSQRGDVQATRDLRAVYAGMLAQKAKEKAILKSQKKRSAALAARARKLKVIAVRKKAEAAIANKLIRVERKHELRKLGKVERMSAAGNKRALTFVKKQAEAAKKGDKRAQDRVAKMKLMRKARQAAPSARERRNLAAAGKLYRSAQKGNPKAVRHVKVLEAAAAKGNPNAKRAVKRLETARALELTIAVGTVAGAAAYASKKRKLPAKVSTNKKIVDKTKAKLASKTASREELAAGSRAAEALGDKETAGKLALAAATAPAATEILKKTATVVNAKEAGNPEAKAAIDASFDAAKKGDASEIKKMGNVVATQTLDDIQKGKDVSPAMRDAVNLQERAAAGDPTAVALTRKISEEATGENPIPEATAAAITLSAAAITAKALAAKPKARQEFMEKVNPPLPPEETATSEAALVAYQKQAREGTITAEDGVKAERLAERLNKHKVAAEIAAYAPPPPPSTPMSTLPDTPQAPIRSVWGAVKESLRAITMSTRDPFQNWREGVQTWSKPRTASQSSGDSAVGWSPFDFFKRNIGIILPALSSTASAATLAVNIANKKAQKAPAPAPAAPAPAAPAPAAEAVKVATSAPTETPATSSGAAPRTLKDFMSQALADKKISKRDFNRAVETQTGPNASSQTKEAVGKKVIEFLAKKAVKIES
jgi:hypothetical protein